MKPRGIRNNNPGNIRKTSQDWKGEIEGDDQAFETFESPEAGLRAIGVILRNYQRRYGLVTVEDIIDRWAPPVENDTGAYARAVAKALGVTVAERIDVTYEDTMIGLMKAITQHENGMQPYKDEVFKRAIAMMG